MAEFLTTEEFERYVQQHDDRQNRFFVEHNGALDRIGREQEKTNKMIEEYNRQIAVLLSEEVNKRESCALEHNARLSKLEKCVSEQGVKLKIPGWVWKGTAALLGLAALSLEIVLAVKVLLR